MPSVKTVIIVCESACGQADVEKTKMEIIPWEYGFTGMGWVDGEVHILDGMVLCCGRLPALGGSLPFDPHQCLDT